MAQEERVETRSAARDPRTSLRATTGTQIPAEAVDTVATVAAAAGAAGFAPLRENSAPPRTCLWEETCCRTRDTGCNFRAVHRRSRRVRRHTGRPSCRQISLEVWPRTVSVSWTCPDPGDCWGGSRAGKRKEENGCNWGRDLCRDFERSANFLRGAEFFGV